MSDRAEPADPQAAAPAEFDLRGTPLCPGIALGVVRRRAGESRGERSGRVPLDRVPGELARFERALAVSRAQLQELRQRLEGRVPEEHARILDVHTAYLDDEVFLGDVRSLVRREQLALEGAIARVVADFDRIFRLVENDRLRERAIDLRDVGLRVMRNLSTAEGESDPRASAASGAAQAFVLVVGELSVSDIVDTRGDELVGVLAESAGATGHAAILARSLHIPSLTAVEGLLERVQEGDFIVMDAGEGIVRVNPPAVVREQYSRERASVAAAAAENVAENGTLETEDGVAVHVGAACGSVPEVLQAVSAGMAEIGIYRTELLYLIDRGIPSADALESHYSAVLAAAGGRPTTFRLLDADSTIAGGRLHGTRDPNPRLGRAGVRFLLQNQALLRTQLRALLLAGRERSLRLCVPLVNDNDDLRRVREVLLEEQFALRTAEAGLQGRCDLGVVIETPAAALGVAGLAADADFLLVSLDGLSQYLLAADREIASFQARFEPLHPVVLRTLERIAAAAAAAGKPLAIFGPSAIGEQNLPLVLGAGIEHFCVPPASLALFRERVERTDASQARQEVLSAREARSQAELRTRIERSRYGH